MKGKAMLLWVTVTLSSFALFAQNPLQNYAEANQIRFSSRQPIIHYTLRVDDRNLSQFEVDMTIRNAQDTFRIAMVMHPEYDDRFWRFVKEIRGESPDGKVTIVRKDSALWHVTSPGGTVAIHYLIKLPVAEQSLRAGWRPFLAPSGGLVGGLHSFLYLVGETLAPSYVRLEIPHGWKSATGLESTSDPTVYFSPSVAVLVDAPILIGTFKTWRFLVDDVPHRIVYWSAPKTTPFDSSRLVDMTKRFVTQACKLFGRLPYREYSFLVQDAAYGALEHKNSVVLGLSSEHLAQEMNEYFGEIAHEYFHTWNLMRIHPAEYGDVVYGQTQLSPGLWWSEGLTMYYADLLSRRANLPMSDSTRISHLQRLIRSYYNTPGNAKISPEKVSLAEYGPTGMLGDYIASAHLQGELLGTMLDLMILESTDGKRSMDDLMRGMMERFSGEKGFSGKDIEQLGGEICACDMKPFFDQYVRGSNGIDFNSFFQWIGIRYTLGWEDGLNDEGKPIEDLRLFGYKPLNEKGIRIQLLTPSGPWGNAGLHSGDEVISINKIPIKSEGDFRNKIRSSHIGDKLNIVVKRPNGIFTASVIVEVYKRPVIKMEDIPGATERQKMMRARWIKEGLGK